MEFKKVQEIELPAAFDAHVHLRDGEMSQLVTPTIRKGGVNTVYVMVSLNSCFSSHAHYRLQSSSARCFFLFVISDIYYLVSFFPSRRKHHPSFLHSIFHSKSLQTEESTALVRERQRFLTHHSRISFRPSPQYSNVSSTATD